MNWLNWCALVLVCSNLAKQELSFLFAKILFGMNVKGQKS